MPNGTTTEKILDFMGEHPALTVILIVVIISGIADIISALR